jgi:hypothetical protein
MQDVLKFKKKIRRQKVKDEILPVSFIVECMTIAI